MRLKKKVEELEKEVKTYKFKLEQIYKLIAKVKWYSYKKSGYNSQTVSSISEKNKLKPKSKRKGEIKMDMEFIDEETKKLEKTLEQVIKENCKEKTQEELINKICKLTKENIKIKAENQTLIMELFLKGDEDKWN